MVKNLLIITIFFMYFGLFAQDPSLFENDWFLNGFNYNGTEIDIPDNEEVSFVPLRFGSMDTDSIPNFHTVVCNYLSSELEFMDNDTTFNLTFPVQSLVVCHNLDNRNFERTYFTFYEQKGNYSYTISEKDDAETLVITSPNGNDSATYINTNLSTSTTVKKQLQLYPNPATSKLYLNIADFEAKTLRIYALDG